MSHFFTCLSFFVAITIAAHAHAGPPVGYGTADSVTPKEVQKLVLVGFEAGLKVSLQDKFYKDVFAVDIDDSASPMGAVRSAQRLLAQGVQVLVGYPSSHEAFLVAGLAQQEQAMFISASAAHSKLAEMGDGVYSVAESMGVAVKATLDFMLKTFGSKRGLVLVNPKALYSMNHVPVIENFLQGDFKTLELDFVNLTPQGLLPKEKLQELKEGKYHYIYYTQYADEAVPSLRQFFENNIDLTILGSHSWDKSDVPTIRPYLFERKNPTYGFAQWIPGLKESKEFETVVKKDYGLEPIGGMAYGYDLGVVVGTTLNRIKEDNVTAQNFKQAFKKNLCFERTSTGKICFSPTGGHAERKFYSFDFKAMFQ